MGTSFAVRVEEAEPAGPPGTEFRLVKLFCGDGQQVPDYDGEAGPPCTAGVYPVRMGAPPEHPMRFRVAYFSAAHPTGVTIQEGVTQITDDMHIDVHYMATVADRQIDNRGTTPLSTIQMLTKEDLRFERMLRSRHCRANVSLVTRIKRRAYDRADGQAKASAHSAHAPVGTASIAFDLD